MRGVTARSAAATNTGGATVAHQYAAGRRAAAGTALSQRPVT